MTKDHLKINLRELLELKHSHPRELEVILEMLAEAGENHYVSEEMEAFEYQNKKSKVA